MTAKLFEEYCDRAGLRCISQELINWFNKYLIGCLSVFTPKDSVWARPNSVLENSNFMDEVKMIETRSRLYSTSPYFECFHDGANAEKIWGWAAVDIFDGETLLDSILANEHRPDIVSYTKDDGRHAFVYELPDKVKDGLPHKIRVTIRGTNINAYGTPKVFTSSSSK
jgi:hypothetical protein